MKTGRNQSARTITGLILLGILAGTLKRRGSRLFDRRDYYPGGSMDIRPKKVEKEAPINDLHADKGSMDPSSE